MITLQPAAQRPIPQFTNLVMVMNRQRYLGEYKIHALMQEGSGMHQSPLSHSHWCTIIMMLSLGLYGSASTSPLVKSLVLGRTAP